MEDAGFSFQQSLLLSDFHILQIFFLPGLKSGGQEISTIEWLELTNRFPSFLVHK